jgi:amidophosphoribosyltransferase
MGGLFGVVSKEDCVQDLFFGTDYHSHLGTSRGGMVVLGRQGFARSIHNIESTPFRSKFEDDILEMAGPMGIGCISDTEPQPLLVRSHLGNYAMSTVGRINNVAELVSAALDRRSAHFLEMSGGEINPTELIATLIDQGGTFEEGIRLAQWMDRSRCCF